MNQFKEISKSVLEAAQQQIKDFPNAFELLGFDFLIDEAMKVWLLEVNSSPTLEKSTEIVSELIEEMAEDTVNILLQ